MKRFKFLAAICVAAAGTLLYGCSTAIKLNRIHKTAPTTTLAIDNSDPEPVGYSGDRDSLVVTDDEGRSLIIMSAIRDDETGEMVAHERLDAAVLVARFRNIAERHGRIDLDFLVLVRDSLCDSRWQLRLTPEMVVDGDTTNLEPVLVTGEDFRKAQLRGYDRYDGYLRGICRDSLYLIDGHQLEGFLSRDSYSVEEEEACEHYTRKLVRSYNLRKIVRKDYMRSRYIPTPIDPSSVRIDSIFSGQDSLLVYHYMQSVDANPKMRKIEILMSGEIRDFHHTVYNIPRGEGVTFYVSSLTTLVDDTPHFKIKIVDRRVEVNASSDIVFSVGSSVVDTAIAANAAEIRRIASRFEELRNDEDLVVDSVTVSASCSPEGSWKFNSALSRRRGAAVCDYFGLGFKSRTCAENWDMLDALVASDSVMTVKQKLEYRRIRSVRDPDARERALASLDTYKYIKGTLYPQLRFVRFDFHLHRKGMVKDTIHTNVPDTAYMKAVADLKDRKYEEALDVLLPYADINTVIAYMSLDKNATALRLAESLPENPKLNYILSVLYARRNNEQASAEHFIKACRAEPQYKYRGNLDPEIAAIIRKYNLDSDYFASLL